VELVKKVALLIVLKREISTSSMKMLVSTAVFVKQTAL
jgi:hypothetical protein